MSPTATIATVVVALLFFAWLFQSDVRDPHYEAWIKRQQESKKAEPAQKASMGINVTDAGVTKDEATIGGDRMPRGGGGGFAVTTGDLVVRGIDGIPISDHLGSDIPLDQLPKDDARRDPVEDGGDKTDFGKGAKLHGTYVGVAYVGDAPKAGADSDAPYITFRRDGSFSTQNMAAAEVDMEAGAAAGASIDRGSGRYRLFENTLELSYTDGMTRKKGSKRVYTVVPVSGDEKSPTAITIQGKIFKLDTSR